MCLQAYCYDEWPERPVLYAAPKHNDIQHGIFGHGLDGNATPAHYRGILKASEVSNRGTGPPGGECLLRYDVLGLRTFLTVCDGELNLLSVCQGLETIALNRAEVYKDVWPIFLSDEAVALCFIEPLHGARNC